jgi:hypothetical protein
MINTEELAAWLQILREEMDRKLPLEKRIRMYEEAGTFLVDKILLEHMPKEFAALSLDTALRASVNAYIIAQQIKI